MVVPPWAVRVAVALLVLIVFVVPYVPVGAWPLPDTGSMEPTMAGCDLLVYGPATNVEVGDVVIFDAPWRDGLVIHRVVDETSGGFVLQGDANASPDPMLVTEDRILVEVHHVLKTSRFAGPLCGPVSDAAVTAFDNNSEYLYH